jgi:acyl carrier protein
MTATQHENQEQMLEQMISEVKKILGKEEVTPDSTFSELGIDSLNIVELILACEYIYPNVQNPEALQINEYTTLRELHEQIIQLSI